MYNFYLSTYINLQGGQHLNFFIFWLFRVILLWNRFTTAQKIQINYSACDIIWSTFLCHYVNSNITKWNILFQYTTTALLKISNKPVLHTKTMKKKKYSSILNIEKYNTFTNEYDTCKSISAITSIKMKYIIIIVWSICTFHFHFQLAKISCQTSQR